MIGIYLTIGLNQVAPKLATGRVIVCAHFPVSVMKNGQQRSEKKLVKFRHLTHMDKSGHPIITKFSGGTRQVLIRSFSPHDKGRLYL